jgi:hypothetical protein
MDKFVGCIQQGKSMRHVFTLDEAVMMVKINPVSITHDARWVIDIIYMR